MPAVLHRSDATGQTRVVVKCLRCAAAIELWYNGGELGMKRCCGLQYELENRGTDLVVTDPAGADARRYAGAAHPYALVQFAELPPKIVGPDGRCTCSATDPCPLGRAGPAERCTAAELRALDREAVSRRAFQSGVG